MDHPAPKLGVGRGKGFGRGRIPFGPESSPVKIQPITAKSIPTFPSTDWDCNSCGSANYKLRRDCFNCHRLKGAPAPPKAPPPPGTAVNGNNNNISVKSKSQAPPGVVNNNMSAAKSQPLQQQQQQQQQEQGQLPLPTPSTRYARDFGHKLDDGDNRSFSSSKAPPVVQTEQIPKRYQEQSHHHQQQQQKQQQQLSINPAPSRDHNLAQHYNKSSNKNQNPSKAATQNVVHNHQQQQHVNVVPPRPSHLKNYNHSNSQRPPLLPTPPRPSRPPPYNRNNVSDSTTWDFILSTYTNNRPPPPRGAGAPPYQDCPPPPRQLHDYNPFLAKLIANSSNDGGCSHHAVGAKCPCGRTEALYCDRCDKFYCGERCLHIEQRQTPPAPIQPPPRQQFKTHPFPFRQVVPRVSLYSKFERERRNGSASDGADPTKHNAAPPIKEMKKHGPSSDSEEDNTLIRDGESDEYSTPLGSPPDGYSKNKHINNNNNNHNDNIPITEISLRSSDSSTAGKLVSSNGQILQPPPPLELNHDNDDEPTTNDSCLPCPGSESYPFTLDKLTPLKIKLPYPNPTEFIITNARDFNAFYIRSANARKTSEFIELEDELHERMTEPEEVLELDRLKPKVNDVFIVKDYKVGADKYYRGVVEKILMDNYYEVRNVDNGKLGFVCKENLRRMCKEVFEIPIIGHEIKLVGVESSEPNLIFQKDFDDLIKGYKSQGTVFKIHEIESNGYVATLSLKLKDDSLLSTYINNLRKWNWEVLYEAGHTTDDEIIKQQTALGANLDSFNPHLDLQIGTDLPVVIKSIQDSKNPEKELPQIIFEPIKPYYVKLKQAYEAQLANYMSKVTPSNFYPGCGQKAFLLPPKGAPGAGTWQRCLRYDAVDEILYCLDTGVRYKIEGSTHGFQIRPVVMDFVRIPPLVCTGELSDCEKDVPMMKSFNKTFIPGKKVILKILPSMRGDVFVVECAEFMRTLSRELRKDWGELK